MRKTIAIKTLLETINFNLQRTDPNATRDYKKALCDTIETALFATGNYHGFMFINNDDSEIDSLGYYSRQYFGH
jgi:hypothetical protein|tara:strand:+ start:815 stop:1036 length:222 start_codon:yes stop_codon:yes gene_type:complete